MLVHHIYNTAVVYVSGPTLHRREGEAVYTHAVPPKDPHQYWPKTTQVTISVQTREKLHSIQGTVIGPRHVLTSGYPIYDSEGWALQVFVMSHIDNQLIRVDRAYTFAKWSQNKDPSYNIALLVLNKLIGTELGYSGLLAAPDSFLNKEEVYANGPHRIQKIESHRVHYSSHEKPLTGTSLRVQRWKTSMIIAIEAQESEGGSYALRMTPLKVEIMSQKVSETIKQHAIFGKKEWVDRYGDIGKQPPLPPNIEEILNAPCPIWPNKKVYQTHLLTLIPLTVNGNPLNLKLLGEIVQQPIQGRTTNYHTFFTGEYLDIPAKASHWTLLSRDVIPGSREKNFTHHQQLVRKYPLYEVPNVLDAAVSIFMEYALTGNKLYSDSPWTFTRCQEKYNDKWQLAVGWFDENGLSIGKLSQEDKLPDQGVGVQKIFN
jgi:hypothetical protein